MRSNNNNKRSSSSSYSIRGSGSCSRQFRTDLLQRSNQPKNLNDELIRFCLLSSVRGVPRILRCRSICWRAIWLVSVVGFLCVSLLFTVRLVSTYLAYQIVLEVTSEPYSDLVPFPSVTVCNLQPFSTDMVKRFVTKPALNGTADVKFLNSLNQLRSHENYSSNFKALTEKSFLYQNWGIDTVRDIGLTFNEFVLDGTCNFSFVKASKYQRRQCNVTAEVLVIPNPQFFTCFMISPSPDIANTTYSLEMDLYLDTEQLFKCRETEECHDALFDLDDSIGAHVLVHPANTYPRMSQLGIHVLPGTKSVIEVVEVKSVEKLGDLPDQACTNQQYLPLYIGSSAQLASVNFSYDSFTCRQLLVQESIRNECHCVDPDYPLNHQLSSAQFCGKWFHNNSNRFFTNYNCASGEELDPRNLGSSSENAKCSPPCNSNIFKTTAYQSLWPPRTNELDFYRLRVQGNGQFDQKFRIYAEAENLTKAGNVSAAAHLLSEKQGSLIRDNFLRLRVFRPDLSRTVTKQKLQISLEALISQIGGSFSLWGGLTVITSVELLEFLYYVAKRLVSMTADVVCNRNHHHHHHHHHHHQQSSITHTEKHDKNENENDDDDDDDVANDDDDNDCDDKNYEMHNLKFSNSFTDAFDC